MPELPLGAHFELAPPALKPKRTQSRKHRGYATQRVVADWFAEHGWPYAESTGAGREGSDITGMPGIDIEVKASSRFSPLAWLKQMRDRGDDRTVSIGVWRADGTGPATVANWPVITDVQTITALLTQSAWGPNSPPGDSDG
jgi:hypothetical protein